MSPTFKTAIKFVTLCAIALACVTMLILDRKKSSKIKKGKKRSNKHLFKSSTYYRLHKLFSENFLTRKGFYKIHVRLSELSVYASNELKIMEVRYYMLAQLYYILIIAYGVFVTKDIYTVIVMIFMATIIKKTFVDKQIAKLHEKLLAQLLDTLINIRQEYYRRGYIPESILAAEKGPMVTNAINEIYKCLTAVDGRERLEEFYATNPFKILKTFAGISFIINKTGDKKDEAGHSNYVNALDMIITEIRLAIQLNYKRRASFGIIEYIPLIPVFTLKIIDNFLLGVFPTTSVFYSGVLGYLGKTIIVIVSLICYKIVLEVGSISVVKKDDRNKFVLSLQKQEWFKQLTINIKPKATKRRVKAQQLIKNSLTAKTVEHLYAIKIVYFVTAITVTIILCIVATQIGKEYIYESTAANGLMASIKEGDIDKDLQLRMDKRYLALDHQPTKEETQKLVESTYKGLVPSKVDEETNRLYHKYIYYHNAYFKWWMVILAFINGWLAWLAPSMLLKLRTRLVRSEALEDVLQLQTIIVILSGTSSDTMDILYWLQKQSTVHSLILSDAYNEYAADPQMALLKLRSRSSLPEFKRLVDKLTLTIYKCSMRKAFEDLINDRQHMLEMRRTTQETALANKRARIGMLVFVPVGLVIMGYIILPTGYLSFKSFKESFSVINQVKGGF